jgi:CYTH domain-containing protein
MTEIERKWLVSEPPAEALAAPSERIDQGYLAIQEDGGEARIRRKGERYLLTVKSKGTLSRSEHEIELSAAQFESLWPATEGRRVEKTRHTLGPIELDVYEGQLAGLQLAEVEFDSEEAAAGYQPPPWFGAELTDDPRYKNSSLARYGRP